VLESRGTVLRSKRLHSPAEATVQVECAALGQYTVHCTLLLMRLRRILITDVRPEQLVGRYNTDLACTMWMCGRCIRFN
jgi:hypothetical protein